MHGVNTPARASLCPTQTHPDGPRRGPNPRRAGVDCLPLLDSTDPTMQRAVAVARQAAPSDLAILLTGESGTGKTTLAQAIHSLSTRSGGPFVVVSCDAFAESSLDRELFGDSRTSESGAPRHPTGRLDAARAGTLFLKNVDSLSASLQVKFLQAVTEHRRARSSNAPTDEPLDGSPRVIAATTHRLEDDVRAKRFREDLFFYLSVVTISLPPLRDRRADLPHLIEHLVPWLAERNGRQTIRLAPGASRLLWQYEWPGNVRELVDVLERALVLGQGDDITSDDLPDRIRIPGAHKGPTLPPTLSLREVERRCIEIAIDESNTLEEAATRLGINPTTLWRQRKRYGLD